jgi:hypothetical protein
MAKNMALLYHRGVNNTNRGALLLLLLGSRRSLVVLRKRGSGYRSVGRRATWDV